MAESGGGLVWACLLPHSSAVVCWGSPSGSIPAVSLKDRRVSLGSSGQAMPVDSRYGLADRGGGSSFQEEGCS